jgi:hypothetical protein
MVARTGGGATEVVEVGPPTAEGTVLLRRADDGALLRVARTVASRFEPHPVVVRAPSPWRTPFDASAVVAIDDTCGPAPQRLELREGAWTMHAPSALPVDGPWLADLTSALARAKAEAWVAEHDDGFGFAAPGGCTVTLTVDRGGGDGGRGQNTLAFGASAQGGFYARAEDGAVFVAPEGLHQLLVHPAVDRSRLRADERSRGGVAVSHDGIRRTLGADAAADDRLASAVANLHAQSALHAGPAARDEGFEHPTLEIAAAERGEGGAGGMVRIVVGARTRVDGADAYFARVSDVDATFAVPAPEVASILSAF